MPETIPFKLNVWFTGNLARLGITCEDVIFSVEQDDSPSQDLKKFFNDLVEPLGLRTFVNNQWKQLNIVSARLYNEGELVWDKQTFGYKLPPAPVKTMPIMWIHEAIANLPAEVPFKETLYLTGGLTRNGFSCRDVDIVVLDNLPNPVGPLLMAMRKFFARFFWMPVDVGHKIMTDKEPVYLLKIYENGKKVI